MTEGIIAFVLWVAVSFIFVIIGIYDLRADKVVGFWSNGKRPEVKKENIKAYNRAVGILWIAFAIAYILLGLPLLAGDNSPYIVITLLGSIVCVIALMAIYVLVIERKYCKR
ncbi:MAG: hypothetical protein E7289_08550 [Lachnospiraceae bacterium]|nr:hypothetical protein [Lachnospiraceae bacterium]